MPAWLPICSCALACAGEWYDSLLGRNIASFVLGAEGPDGSQLSFLMKAHAYECESWITSAGTCHDTAATAAAVPA